ncbi:PLP-dependent transferase [Armillaria gallica]|uniref:PLP-dependent transferase n=1 Tax=Armillaria gallica TaxID=47427 RepID=A0A2H3D8B2_ARMGA|nr:PLP-dependent transferase [Armillaria gallica]
MLIAVREKIASFIGVNDVDEVVLMPNASHGVNTVLKDFIWEEGDVIVTCNTTYRSISRTAQLISDVLPHPERASTIGPRAVAKNAKFVAVVDAIISNPGALPPWEVMTDICREFDVWSVVDAAHAIGQQPGKQLDQAKPDFWISNCHKWLFAKRGAAVLYVPKRNHHIVKSSFPTSCMYISPTPNFVDQFKWNGTVNWTPYLSISVALDFRKCLGGECMIDKYCHSLAIEGGKALARVLNTKVMDEDGRLTAYMVLLVLPFRVATDFDAFEHNVFTAHYDDNGCGGQRYRAQI